MDYEAIWNEICFLVKKNRDVTEDDFQKTAEHLFSLIGWSQHKGEIVSKSPLQVGSSKKVYPDITIKENGRAILMVELKKASVTITEKHVKQLKSYMRLERLDFGILLGESLQIYYDSEEDGNLTKVNDIPFVKDSHKGIECIRLLSKDEYTFEGLQKYYVDILTAAKNTKKAQEYFDLLCSDEGSQIVKDVLKEKLSSMFPNEIIASIIDDISISVSKKEYEPGSLLNRDYSLIDSNKRLNELADNQKLEKSEAIKLCIDNGINILGKKTTFASLNSNGKTYWANPNKSLLTDDWWILLSDHKKKEVHVFNIPANSITENQIKFRKNGQKAGVIEMEIKYDDISFKDSKSKIKFSGWLVKTISY